MKLTFVSFGDVLSYRWGTEGYRGGYNRVTGGVQRGYNRGTGIVFPVL